MTCSCGNRSPETEVVAVTKTEAVVARTGPGRPAPEGMLYEPILAVSETFARDGAGPMEESRVYCCGDECGQPAGAGTPSAIRFEKFSAGEFQTLGEVPLPQKLSDSYKLRGPACLPWVRITRDPARFKKCLDRAREIGPMQDSDVVSKLVSDYLMREDQEVFLVILLDTQLKVRGVSELARGARDRVSVPVPDVLRLAIVEGSTAFIVCHNHPSGNVKPSDADKDLTIALRDAAKTVHIDMLDHVIIAADQHYSFSKANVI